MPTTTVADFLTAIANNPFYVGDISDTSANISAAINNNQFNNAGSHLGTIASNDGATLSLNGNGSFYFLNYGLAPKFIGSTPIALNPSYRNSNYYPLSVAQALINSGHPLSVTFGNYGSDPFQVTVAQISGYASALAAISDGVYSLSVVDTCDPILASIASLTGNSHVTSIGINATGSDISLHLDALQAIASSLAFINVNNGAAITLSVAQVSADAAVLALGSFSLAITDTAATILANLSGLASNSRVSAIIVDDTAANLSAQLDAIQAHLGSGRNGINSIRLTDAAPITVSAAQLINDASALQRITTNYTLTVHDTAANLAASAQYVYYSYPIYGYVGFNGFSPHVTGMVIADNQPITLGAFQFSLLGTILANTTNGDGSAYTISIADTGGNIGSYLDQLQANGHVTSITVTDNGAININVERLTADAGMIALLHNANGSPYTLAIQDSTGNISVALDALQDALAAGHIVSILAYDNYPIISVSIAQLTRDAGVIALIQGYYRPARVAVSDTAAAISADLADLGARYNAGTLTSLNITDNAALSVTAADVVTYFNLLDSSNAGGAQAAIFVTDTAAHLTTASLSRAIDLAYYGHAVQVVISDNAIVTVSVYTWFSSSQFAGFSIANADGSAYHFNVTGFASQLAGTLSALAADTHVTSIAVQDNGALSVNVAQIASLAATLAIVHNADGSAYKLQIVDTAAHISAALDALQSNGHVTTVVISQNAPLTLTASQLVTNAAVLANTVMVLGTTGEGAAAAMASGFYAGATVPYIVSITDSSANISAYLDVLQSNGHVVAVTLTDNGPITASVAQLATDATVLALIGVGAAGYMLAIHDSAANLSATALARLQANSHVASVTVEDFGLIALTVAQAGSLAAILAKTRDADGTAVELSIVDSAASVATAFDALALNGQVAQVRLSNNGILYLTSTQVAADGALIARVSNVNGTLVALSIAVDLAGLVYTLSANIGAVTLTGPGAATLIGNGHAVLTGGEGGDTLIAGDGSGASLYGGGGNDTLIGGLGTNFLSGGTGDDTFLLSYGNATVDGGGGRDAVTFSVASTVATIVRNADGSVTVSGAGFSDRISNVEVLHFTDRNVVLRELARTDLDGNGGSDLIWRNATNGAVNYFQVSNGAATWQSAGWVSQDWSAAGSGDFNGDGSADILFRRASDGALGFLSKSGAGWTWNGAGLVDATWTVVGTGDFNGDGIADIAYTKGTAAGYYAFSANGARTWASLGSTGGLTAVGTGDFNADSRSDILFANASSGTLAYLDSSTQTIRSIGNAISSSWHFAGTGDFNGDGTSDVLMYNASLGGALGYWAMNANGTAQWSGFSGLGTIDTAWSVAATGDYNNDGTADVLLYNATSGATGIISTHGTSAVTWAGLGVVNTGWQLA